MTVDVGDVVRCVAEFTIPDGTFAQLVYHYRGKSGSAATAALVGANLLISFEGSFDGVDQAVADAVLGNTFEMFQWDAVLNQWDGVYNAALGGSDGLHIGQMVPHGAAALGKIFTTSNRRQARKYLMGMVEDNTDEGTIAGATVTEIALFLAALDADVVAGTLTLEFGTFNTEPASPLFETFSVATQSVQAEALIAYQRRRRPGTGI